MIIYLFYTILKIITNNLMNLVARACPAKVLKKAQEIKLV